MSLLSLQRKIAKLEGGGGAPLPPLGSGWWDDFSDFSLVLDPSWRPHCDLDRFVVGRAALLACLWGGRLINGYAHWQRYEEPYWWSDAAWRSKTPDWQEQVERERQKFCPKENRQSMALFLEWFYGDSPKKHEGDRPELWCSRDTGSSYHWPDWGFYERGQLALMHSLAIAAAIWLVDGLRLSPNQVGDAASAHYCAFKWRDLGRLAQVALPKQGITGSSPKLRLIEMAQWCKAHGIPVSDECTKGHGAELLEVLMLVPSGCAGDHGHGLIFPFLTVLEP